MQKREKELDNALAFELENNKYQAKQIEEISRIANASVVGSHIVKIIENELIANKNNALIHEKVLKEVKLLSLGLN